MTPRGRDELSRASWLLTGGRAMALAATFFIPMVLARVFSAEAFGTYKQIFLVYYTLFLVAPFGMAESLFYFLPSASGRAGAFVANATGSLALAGAAAGCGLLAAAGPTARLVGNPGLETHVPLLALLVALSIASAPLEIVLIARGRNLAAALAYGLSDIARAVGLVLPALIWHSLDALLLGAVVYAGLRLGATLAIYVREFGATLRPGRAAFVAQLAYVAPFGAAVIVDTLQANLHMFVVAHRVDPATYAVYAVGCLQLPLVDLIAGPAGNVMMVRMREGLEAVDREAVLSCWRDTMTRIAAFVVPLTVGLLVLAPSLIEVLFTARYRASVPIFVVWTTSLAFAVFQTDGVLRVLGQTRLIFGLSVLKLVIVAVSIGPLLGAIGLPGAALSALTATLVAKLAALHVIRRRLSLSLPDLLPWRDLARTTAIAVAAAVPVMLARELLPPSPAVGLVAGALAFAAVWLALQVGLRPRVERPCAESPEF